MYVYIVALDVCRCMQLFEEVLLGEVVWVCFVFFCFLSKNIVKVFNMKMKSPKHLMDHKSLFQKLWSSILS